MGGLSASWSASSLAGLLNHFPDLNRAAKQAFKPSQHRSEHMEIYSGGLVPKNPVQARPAHLSLDDLVELIGRQSFGLKEFSQSPTNLHHVSDSGCSAIWVAMVPVWLHYMSDRTCPTFEECR